MAMTLGYTVPARVYPVLIVCLPAALAVASWFPDESWHWGILSAAGVLGALTMLVAQLGRDLGKAKEADLWLSWGGKPTTQLLRHRDRHLDSITKGRYHTRLANLMGITLPTAEEEAADPGAADNAYNSCVLWLIAQTRAVTSYRLLFKENVSYGFRRNLWAMRPAGSLLAVLGLIMSFIPLVLFWAEGPRVMAGVAVVLNTILLVLWCLRITSDWIQLTAYRYAEELLSTIDMMKA